MYYPNSLFTSKLLHSTKSELTRLLTRLRKYTPNITFANKGDQGDLRGNSSEARSRRARLQLLTAPLCLPTDSYPAEYRRSTSS